MKKNKVIVVLVLAMTLLLMFPLVVKAAQVDPDKFEPIVADGEDAEEIYIFGGSIAGAIQIIGTAVSVGTLIVIGIRYVFASADGKAEFKERLLPYVIGCVFLFGATNLVSMIYKKESPHNSNKKYSRCELCGEVAEEKETSFISDIWGQYIKVCYVCKESYWDEDLIECEICKDHFVRSKCVGVENNCEIITIDNKNYVKECAKEKVTYCLYCYNLRKKMSVYCGVCNSLISFHSGGIYGETGNSVFMCHDCGKQWFEDEGKDIIKDQIDEIKDFIDQIKNKD